MRQTLIRVFLDEPWALWKVDHATGLPGPGIAVLLVVAGIGWAIWSRLRREQPSWKELRSSLPWWGLALIAVTFARMPAASLPIFGYGCMLLVGFLAAIKLAQWRAAQIGIDRDLVFDAGFWILIGGVIGARLWYLAQYHDDVFAAKQGWDVIVAVFNLTQGGMVVYGGMLLGTVAFFAYCFRVRHKVGTLNMADIVMPSVFIGMGFGRIGCLLNGCCYGGPCELPWGIRFPAGSVTWQALVHRGFLEETAAATFALHPTQIYSSINGFLLAWVTAAYFPHRRRPGEVFALGCILYSITRFIIEFLRNDEMGIFGTDLTISQATSLGVCAAGITLLAVLSRRPPLLTDTSAVGQTS